MTLDSIASGSAPEVATFAELLNDSSLVDALTAIGITKATPVQAAAVPLASNHKDIIVQAQTGSGKTLAFVLPLIGHIRREPNFRGTYGLIICPTRELATQVQSVVSSIAPDIKPACLIGGANIRAQIRSLEEDPRIVVGTPGRIQDLYEQRELKLNKCRYFVLDEADEMLSMGFLEEVRSILSKLPRERQGMFFSATITPRVEMLAQSFLTKPEKVVIAVDESKKPDIEHLFCKVDSGVTSKASALCRLIEAESPDSAIVFCNTKSDTELVEVFLKRRGFNARRINSDLSQKERESIMSSLRSGELRLLIATDVAARGIDIEQLDLVVNYAIHDQVETYVHRTGRTGRAGRSGKAISIIAPQDACAFHGVTKTLSIEIKEIPVPAALPPAEPART